MDDLLLAEGAEFVLVAGGVERLRDVFGVTRPVAEYMWFGIAPISAGVFGVPIGLVTIWIVSLLTPAPSREVQDLVEHVRYPNLAGDMDTRAT